MSEALMSSWFSVEGLKVISQPPEGPFPVLLFVLLMIQVFI